MKPFPWPQAMSFGLGVLRLAPKDFWAMTPRELSHAIRGVRGPLQEPMNRASLSELMRAFPDKQKDTTNGH